MEGHDGSGKTHIVGELSKQLKIPYFRNSKTNNYINSKIDFLLAMYYDQEYIVQFLEQTKYSVIFDRAYPSNYVYGEIFSRPMDYSFLRYIDERFFRLNTKIIICDKIIYKKDFNDENIDFEDIDFIKALYFKFRKNFTLCKTFNIDTTDECLDKQIKMIRGWLYNE